MNEALKKNEKYQKRYMKRHRMLCVCLDRKKGEYKNPNGSMTCNIQVYRCNPSLCSYCNPGVRKNANSSMEVD